MFKYLTSCFLKYCLQNLPSSIHEDAATPDQVYQVKDILMLVIQTMKVNDKLLLSKCIKYLSLPCSF